MGAFREERAVATWNRHSQSAGFLQTCLRAGLLRQFLIPYCVCPGLQSFGLPAGRRGAANPFFLYPGGLAPRDFIKRGGDAIMR
jgi:hypothetical protein